MDKSWMNIVHSPNKVNERHGKQFALWLQERADTHLQSYTSEVRILSRGPSNSVNQYTGCMVNGYMFHTQSREYNRKTQSSGVVVYSDHATNLIDYYGKLQEVLEVEYLGENKRVLVFKCDWFKVDDGKGIQVDKESGVTSVNVSRKWYKDQPYILASQAKQVFYVPDLKLGINWNVVEKHVPSTLYDVPVHMEDEVYQEEEPNLNLIDDDDYDFSASNSDDDDDDVDVDATNSNSSQEEESCDDDDLTHTATSESSEKDDSLQDDDYISSD
ncbi:Myb domain protein 62 [Tanacetum coccineum]